MLKKKTPLVPYFQHKDGDRVSALLGPFPSPQVRETQGPKGNKLQQPRGESGGLTITGAFRAHIVTGVAVSDTAVGTRGILTMLGAAQGWAPLSTFVHV